MDLETILDDRDRLTRTLLAGTLAVVSLRSFRKKNRLLGVLAGAGAVGLGYTAAVRSPDVTEESDAADESVRDVETTGEDGGMRCPACSEPIVVGESRRPNANNQIVHERCL
ncbi:hypothetical protein SAMN04487948_12121 [Halogranum amylolyticum]|uniref:DUF2892 domain-containing protein n=1 Tax=Halogranum amylolyticum TaxID=660520 RepID=A0A1H8VYM0_9EURY|nr:hypothetical protein [Halogranum amylolyticum]SEP20491.1 hypothetical protein SAMN04487948_12121 [Halogranum amylolyticum]